MAHDLICEWCKTPFVADRLKSKGKLRRFCGTQCSAKWRMSRPEYVATLNTERRRESSRRSMALLREREDVQEKLAAHLFSDNNPFKNPLVRQKAHKTLAKRGYPQLNGGNGRPPSNPQSMLAKRLGWKMEYVYPTKRYGMGYPTHYKIDIANPDLMIAIEVHGCGHLTKGVKEKDIKKQLFLESKGWTVLTFWNQEILDNLEDVISRVQLAVLSII